MRKLILVTALAGAASILAACSQRAEEAAATAEPTDVASNTAAATTGADTAAPVLPAFVNANTATEAQLAGVAGVTPEIAEAIVAGRPYADADAFGDALEKTTSKQAAAELMTRVFVPVNLNTASEDAIKRIPGMTPKMVHEFLEYRPYADLAEFDREIGKYVDEAEVARFRNYVTL